MKNSFVDEAVKMAGGISEVAKALHVTPRLVHYWIHGTLPFWAAAGIEILTEGKATRQELCPVYYEPLKSLDHYVKNARRAA